MILFFRILKQFRKPKFVNCLTKFVMDLTIRTCPIFNSGCARLRDRHYKGKSMRLRESYGFQQKGMTRRWWEHLKRHAGLETQ